MNKTLKKIIITVLVLALAGGGVYGGLVFYKQSRREPVKVYDMQNICMTNYYGDNSEAYGMVTTDKLQNVGISDTQRVNEIYVAEGQQVKEGDQLLSYDTTLSDIDLEKAGIDLERKQLQLETAKKELKTIKNLKPHSSVLITPEPLGIVYTPHETKVIIAGSGSAEDPYYYLWGEDDRLDMSTLAKLLETRRQSATPVIETPGPGEEGETMAEGETQVIEPEYYEDVYVAFVTRMNNALNGPIIGTWGVRATDETGSMTMQFYEPVLSEEVLAFEEEPQPYYKETGSPYTSKEIAQMRADKEKEIQDLELAIEMAKVEYERLQVEVNDGVVRSKLDGVVKAVRDPEEAIRENKPVVEVSGGGGYYIQVAMSEMALDSMTIGQTVTVNSWETGTMCEGTVVAVSEYPATNADAWSEGNNNVSYYPFTVFVDENEDLREFSYVSVSYSVNQQEDNTLYLESMFIKTENGKSVVYVKGEDGKLEQRTVQTGRNLWGSYTQIRGGLTVDDRIAFPYGSDVIAGADTVDAEIEELYNSVRY